MGARISIDDLNAAIKSGTSYTGAGQLDSDSSTAILSPKGQLETPEQYGDLIVGGTSNAPIYLRDVATIEQSVQDERVNMRFWVRGYPVPSATVILAVNRRAGANGRSLEVHSQCSTHDRRGATVQFALRPFMTARRTLCTRLPTCE